MPVTRWYSHSYITHYLHSSYTVQDRTMNQCQCDILSHPLRGHTISCVNATYCRTLRVHILLTMSMRHIVAPPFGGLLYLVSSLRSAYYILCQCDILSQPPAAALGLVASLRSAYYIWYIKSYPQLILFCVWHILYYPI